MTLNKTIQEFKEKYEKHLQVLDKKFQKQNEDLVKEMNASFNVVDERAKKIERLIIEEKEERIRYTEAELAPIRKGLLGILDKLV